MQMQRNLINNIIFEATYEKDKIVTDQIKKIIQRIKNIVYNYNGENNGKADWYNKEKVFYIELSDLDLIVVLFDKNSQEKLALQANDQGSDGVFYGKLNPKQLHLFNCVFYFNEETNKFSHVDFNEQTAFHELVHYLDYARLKGNNFKSNQKKGNFNSDYYNSPLEFNAYFMEKIIPEIESLIQDPKITRLVKEGGWNKFKQLMVSSPNIEVYYNKLDEKYRKKFLKRLAEYYQKITQNV